VFFFSFKKDKIPTMDRWTIEFYQGSYEMLENDIMEVVEESRNFGKFFGSLISIFVAVILNKDKISSFEAFMNISLYNVDTKS
jgi:hypothetical protein